MATICKICNKEFSRISVHVKYVHNLQPKEYYDTYIKQKNEGICEREGCNNPTVFVGITYGYRHHCSVSCSSSDKKVQAKNKTTSMKLYGVYHNWNNGDLRKKQEQTMLKKYGVTHNWKSGSLRSKEKFKISKLEQFFMDKLDQLGIDYEYRYYDESGRYSYECDFYLTDSDTFVEINGTALHDNHIFEKKKKKDLEHLEYLKSKNNSSWYQSKLRIWLKDKEKYDIAIKNKLNYYILWNEQDIIDYCNTL